MSSSAALVLGLLVMLALAGVALATGVARRRRAGLHAPARVLAERHGLAFDPKSGSARGAVDGLPVHLRWDGAGVWLEARIRTAAPRALRIRDRAVALAGPSALPILPTGDAAVDRLLALQSSDAGACATLLSNAEVLDALRSPVPPGALVDVEERSIRLWAPVHAMEPALAWVLVLAAAMDRVGAALEPSRRVDLADLPQIALSLGLAVSGVSADADPATQRQQLAQAQLRLCPYAGRVHQLTEDIDRDTYRLKGWLLHVMLDRGAFDAHLLLRDDQLEFAKSLSPGDRVHGEARIVEVNHEAQRVRATAKTLVLEQP